MKLTSILLVGIIIMLLCKIGKTQTISPPIKAKLGYELLHPKEITTNIADTLRSPKYLLTNTDTIKLKLRFSSPDTINISKIHVKLGTTAGGNELATLTFNYDDYNQANPFTYYRKKNKIALGIGTFLYQSGIYCDVWLEDNNQLQTTAASCQIK